MRVNKGANSAGGALAKEKEKEDVTKSCVTDLLSGAESEEIWIKRISRCLRTRRLRITECHFHFSPLAGGRVYLISSLASGLVYLISPLVLLAQVLVLLVL